MSQPEEDRRAIIRDHPIRNGLDTFRTVFGSQIVLPPNADLLDGGVLRSATVLLCTSLIDLDASGLLTSTTSVRRTIRDDIEALVPACLSADFDFNPVKPLLRAAAAQDIDDAALWDLAATAAGQGTPPPPLSIDAALLDTPWRHSTGSFVNSSEFRRDIDRILKVELGSLCVDVDGFHDVLLGANLPDLDVVSDTVFRRCCVDDPPLFREGQGWDGWPEPPREAAVIAWFERIVAQLEAMAHESGLAPTTPSSPRRCLLARPSKPIQGSTGDRRMDIGLVRSASPRSSPTSTQTQTHWSQVLVPGELEKDTSADSAARAWFDLGRYAREVLSAQDTRRFVLGFTLCGPLMRLWEFDRLGGMASTQFDINIHGRRFVASVLGLLWLDERGLGFDPTIHTRDGNERCFDIIREGHEAAERIVLDKLLRRSRCIAGRATTCWLAHSQQHPGTRLVVKDSWQHPERPQEGEVMREATARGVHHVARYYHHMTVQVDGQDDDVLSGIRRGLDCAGAKNAPFDRKPSARAATRWGTRSNSSPCTSSTPNRVHRRIILRDVGKPIFTASSPGALVAALECCITGHESLLKAGILHRDISVNNLMLNDDDDDDDDGGGAFLIDLDLAVPLVRTGASGAQGKTGTRAFMAIGALLGHAHSFMHDLESFFWVLFWISIHYDGPSGVPVGPTEYESWNYDKDVTLISLKTGLASQDALFDRAMTYDVTPFYRPLVPLLHELRTAVFPKGHQWEREERGLYGQMRGLLGEWLERLA